MQLYIMFANVLKFVKDFEVQNKNRPQRIKNALKAGVLLKFLRNGAFSEKGKHGFVTRFQILDILLPLNPLTATHKLTTAILEAAGTESGLRALSRIKDAILEIRKYSVPKEEMRAVIIYHVSKSHIYGDQVAAMAAYTEAVRSFVSQNFVRYDRYGTYRDCYRLTETLRTSIHTIKDFVNIRWSDAKSATCNRLTRGLEIFLKVKKHFDKPPKQKIPGLSYSEIANLVNDEFHYGHKAIPNTLEKIRQALENGETYETLGDALVSRHRALFESLKTDHTAVFYDTACRLYKLMAMRTVPATILYQGYFGLNEEQVKKAFMQFFKNLNRAKTVDRIELVSDAFSGKKVVSKKTLDFMLNVTKELNEPVVWTQIPCTQNSAVLYLPESERFVRFVNSKSLRTMCTKRLQILSKYQVIDICQEEEEDFSINVDVGKLYSKEYYAIYMKDVLGKDKKIEKLHVPGKRITLDILAPSPKRVYTAEEIFPALCAAIQAGCGDLSDRNFEFSEMYKKVVFIDVDKGGTYIGNTIQEKILAALNRNFPRLKKMSSELTKLAGGI